MVTNKVRTEYMKKFRDPRWETFSKCYEDSLKYRLTRRVMEHSHKPWFWEGWDGASDSSGVSTPRPSRNKVAPLSVAPAPPPQAKQRSCEPMGGLEEAEAAVRANGEAEAGRDTKPPSDHTDSGPADTSSSSEGEPVMAAPRRRRRAPRSDPAGRDASRDERQAAARKQRAKSQPPGGTKGGRRASGRPERTEVRATPTDSHPGDTRRPEPERRRARSADLEKAGRSRLTAVDDHWMTEYMRCFSARLR